ncbi:MAG TPA: tRNA 2-thiouridine(34) synthase MnmA [Candidatus Nanopelagicales bacterium]|nr:tRNA 2-thiouridine(34) synthase MnmA [Candidatus Nanopelagicales bacterium]
MRVIAALSGGVDSSVAAARVVDAGHEVVGVHLALARAKSTGGRSRGCCTIDDARDARRVADMLGIPFYVWDFSAEFAEEVIEDFLAEYEADRTPNPCLRCNEKIKFRAVLDRAMALGFDAVATGHYARIVESAEGVQLHRAVDSDKDQSYVLAVLDHEQIRHCMFPLGESVKSEVRDEAEARGLRTARKPDSHDICFIPDGDTQGFLVDRLGDRPGRIVDSDTGAQVGEHSGTFTVTIGQRRGLNLRVPAEDGQPRYVIDVDSDSDTVYVGPATALDIWSITAEQVIWAGAPMGEDWEDVHAQVRAHHVPVPARARCVSGVMQVELLEPVRGLARGQSVALYSGTRVIGAGRVERTDRHSATSPVGADPARA